MNFFPSLKLRSKWKKQRKALLHLIKTSVSLFLLGRAASYVTVNDIQELGIIAPQAVKKSFDSNKQKVTKDDNKESDSPTSS